MLPNPSTGKYSILGDVEILRASLFAIDGTYIQTLNGNFRNVDLTSYPAGVYILKVVGVNGMNETKKLILYK